MSMTVRCLTCGTVVASTTSDLLCLVMLGLHANGHELDHALALDVTSGPHALRVRCGKCAAEECWASVGAHMLTPLTLAFHSRHEGHPLWLWVDGELAYPREAASG
jgi:ribosomal protein S27E